MRKLYWAAVVLLSLLIGARVALPYVVLQKINDKLADLEGYEGQVDKLRLSLLRGGFTLIGLEISDSKGDLKLTLPRLAVNASWSDMIRKRLIVRVAAEKPRLELAAPTPLKAAEKAKEKARKAEATVESKTGKTISQLIASLMPFRVERFTISGGAVSVKQALGQDLLKIGLTDLEVEVEGLTNIGQGRLAKGRATAKVMDSGRADLTLTLDPTAEEPTFDLAFELKDLDLKALNPALRWQWDVDVDAGTFEMFSQTRAKDGGFEGYVKPFIKDLRMGERKGGPMKKVKEAVVGAVAKVLENKKTEAVATQVPFRGRFEDPKTGVWEAVIAVLRNAFVEALTPRLGKG